MARKLKKLMQEWSIPPWERDTIPLIYSGSELICVPGYAYSAKKMSTKDEEGIEILVRSNDGN